MIPPQPSSLMAGRTWDQQRMQSCGKSNLIGSISPGKFADIIAVDGVQLIDDISVLEQVFLVMKEGKTYKQKLL